MAVTLYLKHLERQNLSFNAFLLLNCITKRGTLKVALIDHLYLIYQAWVNDTLTTDEEITYTFTKSL